MAWDYTISDLEEKHDLHIMLYDKDILTSDDLIGSNVLSFDEIAIFAFKEDLRQSAKLNTDPDTNTTSLQRIKWNADKDECKMPIEMTRTNKNGEPEYSGKVWISFSLIPDHAAKLSPVGVGRDAPNNDPFLPEPAGRISLMGGMFGGFFCIAGHLKE